nr:uncharacterized protein LOC119180214 [Rhipicephalus microplus]
MCRRDADVAFFITMELSRRGPCVKPSLLSAERAEVLKKAARARIKAHRRRWINRCANPDEVCEDAGYEAVPTMTLCESRAREVEEQVDYGRSSPEMLPDREPRLVKQGRDLTSPLKHDPVVVTPVKESKAKPKCVAKKSRASRKTRTKGLEVPDQLASGTGDMLHQWLLKSIEVMDEDSRSTDSPSQSQPGTPLQASHSPGAVNLGLVAGEAARHPQTSKYTQLLAVIEELGRDIRPTYAGSKSSAERLKRGIVHARILVRECLMETERNARS